MTKTRNVVITIFITIFCLGIWSYIEAYNDVIEQTQIINNELSTSVDSALEASLASDEFFRSGVKGTSGSGRATSYDSDSEVSNILYMRGAGETYNGFATILLDDDNILATENLTTGQMSSMMKKLYDTEDFKQFTEYLHSSNKFESPIWVLDTTGKKYEEKKVCTTALTGINSVLSNSVSGVLSEYIGQTEDLELVKKGRGGNEYFLTPTALGITYINPDLYLGVLRSNIELQCAYNHIAEENVYTELDIIDAQLETEHLEPIGTIHSGLINTAFPKNGFNVATDSEGNEIINNGTYGVDLNGIEVKIEYKYIDMFDSSNNRILDEVFGAIPQEYSGRGAQAGQEYKMKNGQGVSAFVVGDAVDHAKIMQNGYNQRDASGSIITEKYIVVAKVITRIPIYLPYKSTIMQQYASNSERCVQGVTTGASGEIVADDSTNNVYYEYTKYVAVTP